jgi:hypothetical protein
MLSYSEDLKRRNRVCVCVGENIGTRGSYGEQEGMA